MFCPIVTAILFNLSNLFYVFGMIIVSVGVVCSLFLRIGSNINLLFMANSIIIQDAKENMEIRKDEISLIKIHQHSGSRPAFALEIYQISGCKKTILIDKFRFQNPRRKLGMLVELEEWKEVIEL
jgi:hypothetical protein